MTWLAIVRIVLWEVSQELPTVVQGGKIIEICVRVVVCGGMSNLLTTFCCRCRVELMFCKRRTTNVLET